MRIGLYERHRSMHKCLQSHLIISTCIYAFKAVREQPSSCCVHYAGATPVYDCLFSDKYYKPFSVKLKLQIYRKITLACNKRI